MNNTIIKAFTLVTGLVFFLTGCSAIPDDAVLGNAAQQLKLRSIQSRVYETTDKSSVLRNVISTLQDLDFLIESADLGTGTVSARKFAMKGIGNYSNLKITISVQPKSARTMTVRANAEFNNKLLEDPVPYQNFFTALNKSLFLSGKLVE
ncbi:MAG: hypothetical protein OEY78_04475 [Gammaproteobacteria bacterium]|nr:hypothetical protein [Gammaproteobacteria bacterium]